MKNWVFSSPTRSQFSLLSCLESYTIYFLKAFIALRYLPDFGIIQFAGMIISAKKLDTSKIPLYFTDQSRKI